MMKTKNCVRWVYHSFKDVYGYIVFNSLAGGSDIPNTFECKPLEMAKETCLLGGSVGAGLKIRHDLKPGTIKHCLHRIKEM